MIVQHYRIFIISCCCQSNGWCCCCPGGVPSNVLYKGVVSVLYNRLNVLPITLHQKRVLLGFYPNSNPNPITLLLLVTARMSGNMTMTNNKPLMDFIPVLASILVGMAGGAVLVWSTGWAKASNTKERKEKNVRYRRGWSRRVRPPL